MTYVRKKQKGFTLIEIMVVLVLIAVGMGVVANRIFNTQGASIENNIQSDIGALRAAAMRWKVGKTNYTGIDCDALVTNKYITNEWASCTGVNPADGNYTVTANSSTSTDLDIGVTGLETPMCNRLANTYQSQGTASCSGGTLTVTFGG